MRIKKILNFGLLSLVSISNINAFAAEPMNLDNLLRRAEENSEAIQASEKTIQSIRAEISGRDLLLSPKLEAEVADARDNRDSVAANQRFRTQLLDVSLTKLFSTGTQVSVSAGHDITSTETTGRRNIGSWEFKVSQSLWRDAFGRNTKLRHQAEEAELQARTLTAVYQRQSFLVELENAYWDLLYAKKEEDVRRSNIERSETVEKWTRDRARRSMAEPTDLLQAQALVSSRQLELIGVRNRIESLQNRIQQLVPNQTPRTWQIDLKELEASRPFEQLLTGSGSAEPVRLDSLSSRFRAQQADSEASRTDDSLRPKVDAYVSYGQNGADERFATSWDRAKDPQFSAARVGVTLSMDLDWTLKDDQRRAARLNAEARELEARAQSRLSNVGWADLKREIDELKRQEKEAGRLADLQEKKVAAERSRYRLGRTTVFQLITFEIDAANSQITLARIRADLRKLEARARIFTRQAGVQ